LPQDFAVRTIKRRKENHSGFGFVAKDVLESIVVCVLISSCAQSPSKKNHNAFLPLDIAEELLLLRTYLGTV